MGIRKTAAISLFGLASLLAAACAGAQPRHVYLTYSGAPETSIDVNVIMPDRARKGRDAMVYYDTVSRGGTLDRYAQRAAAAHYRTLMELSDRRAMYVAALKDLKPHTVYYFVAGSEEGGYTPERKFRTLPGGDSAVRFVEGGDMGVDGRVIPLLELAARQDPDFAVIGGDIAYADGLLGNFAIWDAWLNNWTDHMVTPDGRMVPIVTAIGNHEVGRYESDNEELRSPWYTSLFGRQGNEIYHSLRIGDHLVLFLLDSGHLNPYEGKQAAWLEQEMAKYRDIKYKFAAYHVPLYPAHRDYEAPGSVQGRQYWAPLFDRYGLTVSFEHHDHVFKRSKPLKGGEVADGGTIYVGDGCFGRPPRTVDPQPRWYNQVEGSFAHFWVVDVGKDGVHLKAVGEQRETIDQFSRP